MQVAPIRRIVAVAAGLMVAAAAFLAAAGPLRADDPLSVPAGGSTQVALVSNVASYPPPCTSHANPTKVTVFPDSVTVAGMPEGLPAAGTLVTVNVPAGLPAGLPIVVSWSGNDGSCTTWNGSITMVVGPAAGGGGAGPPGPPAGAVAPGVVQACKVVVGGRPVTVYLEGETSCALARDIALGRLAGWTCAKAPLSPARRYVICQRAGAWGVALPASGGECRPVTHRGRRYRVAAAKVLCRYARATALRMLRRTTPYVYEFVSRAEARRWRCRIFGRGVDERGACHKRVEERWVVYFPAGR
jgi:hypothetical protein